ncbi:MAG: ThuA domain-containing protein [Planctomycetota bacterium]
MTKHALIVHGGWDGHTPTESAHVFAPLLADAGIEVTLRDSLDAYTDADLMASAHVVVPIWTMGEISKEQWQGLRDAVVNGCGVAGFHGGMIDAFRSNTEYQWMTGAQWVAHPGNAELTYDVRVADATHPITRGLAGFTLPGTEQYYCHHDPGNHVLCTTVINPLPDGVTPDYNGLYPTGVTHPYAWTRQFGKGRVFGACWGHTFKDFDVPEAKEIVRRGILWAASEL